MRTDAPATPRAPETNPRRLPAASSGMQQPSAPADCFAALLLAADDSPASNPLPQSITHPAVEPTSPASEAPTPTFPLGQTAPQPPSPTSPAPRFEAHAEATPSHGTPSDSPAGPSGPNGTEGAASGKASPAATQPQTTSPWVSTVAKARAQPIHLAASTATAELAPGHAGHAGLYQRPAAALAWNPYSAGTGAAAGPGTATAQGAPDEFDAGALVALSAGARGESSSREGSGQGARGGDATRALIESPPPSGTGTDTTKADADFSHLLEQATAQGLDAVWEPLGQHISLWLAGQVKRANLLLHEGMRQTLEIEIKLDGQQAQLDFLTDDEQLRESLRSQAHEALAELLGQNGLELVGLSIGSRASGQSDRSTAQRPQASSARAEVTDTAADQPTVVLQPATGRAGLSVYA